MKAGNRGEGIARQIRSMVGPAGLFRCPVKGDSMEPEWHDGDIVELRVCEDVSQLERGKDYWVIRRDAKATFKRFTGVEGRTLVFRALNRAKFRDAFKVQIQEVAFTAIALAKFVPV